MACFSPGSHHLVTKLIPQPETESLFSLVHVIKARVFFKMQKFLPERLPSPSDALKQMGKHVSKVYLSVVKNFIINTEGFHHRSIGEYFVLKSQTRHLGIVLFPFAILISNLCQNIGFFWSGLGNFSWDFHNQ